MHFRTGFPADGKGKFDSIMIVVDRLTKRAIFIANHKSDTAEIVAQHFLDRIIGEHGFPNSIVIDRDPRFISGVWKTINKMWGIDHRLSTAAHPQTDGQTERMNRLLIQLVEACSALGIQRSWLQCLHMIRFAYNSQFQESIKTTLFFADLGYHPEYWEIIVRPSLSQIMNDANILTGNVFVVRQEHF